MSDQTASLERAPPPVWVDLLALGLAFAVGFGAAKLTARVATTMSMLVVFSDETVKVGQVDIALCAQWAELAQAGKVPGVRDGPFAVAAVCAPETVIKETFSRRHTP